MNRYRHGPGSLNLKNEHPGGYAGLKDCSEFNVRIPVGVRGEKDSRPTYKAQHPLISEHLASFQPAVRCSESGFLPWLAPNTPTESVAMVQYHHIWE